MEESVKNGREEKNDRRVTNMKISFSIYLFSPTLPYVSRGWVTVLLGAAVQCNVPYEAKSLSYQYGHVQGYRH
jgi:hypothetical protein